MIEKIVTERLVLRPFRESDYDNLYEFLSKLRDDEFEGYPDITCENGWEQLKARLDSDEFYAVTLKESAKVISNVYCGNRDYNAREVGYIINKHYQRKGYAREALQDVSARRLCRIRPEPSGLLLAQEWLAGDCAYEAGTGQLEQFDGTVR